MSSLFSTHRNLSSERRERLTATLVISFAMAVKYALNSDSYATNTKTAKMDQMNGIAVSLPFLFLSTSKYSNNLEETLRINEQLDV